MNLGTMETALRSRLGVPATDAFYTDVVIDELLNSAAHFLEGEEPWAWLEKEQTINTANGTSTYAVAADYRASIALLDPAGFPLEQVEAKMLRRLIGASGVPKLWDILGTNVRVAPTPTGVQALVHSYLGGETDMASDSDTLLLPVVYHRAVVEYAAYLAYRRAHNAPEAGAAKAAYDEWLALMRKEAPRYSKDTGGGMVVGAPAPAAP